MPNSFVFAEEAIDSIEMLGTVLKGMAKRDAKEALIIAMGLTHPGFESLAHLAISKGLLEETKKAPARARQPKKPIKQ